MCACFLSASKYPVLVEGIYDAIPSMYACDMHVLRWMGMLVCKRYVGTIKNHLFGKIHNRVGRASWPEINGVHPEKF